MSDTCECEWRATEYLLLAEAEAEPAVKALLLEMHRNWTLLGELERVEIRRPLPRRRPPLPRVPPHAVLARIFVALACAETQGGALRRRACRWLREALYARQQAAACRARSI